MVSGLIKSHSLRKLNTADADHFFQVKRASETVSGEPQNVISDEFSENEGKEKSYFGRVLAAVALVGSRLSSA